MNFAETLSPEAAKELRKEFLKRLNKGGETNHKLVAGVIHSPQLAIKTFKKLYPRYDHKRAVLTTDGCYSIAPFRALGLVHSQQWKEFIRRMTIMEACFQISNNIFDEQLEGSVVCQNFNVISGQVKLVVYVGVEEFSWEAQPFEEWVNSINEINRILGIVGTVN